MFCHPAQMRQSTTIYGPRLTAVTKTRRSPWRTPPVDGYAWSMGRKSENSCMGNMITHVPAWCPVSPLMFGGRRSLVLRSLHASDRRQSPSSTRPGDGYVLWAIKASENSCLHGKQAENIKASVLGLYSQMVVLRNSFVSLFWWCVETSHSYLSLNISKG
jgi:hypothetical protein